MEQSRRQAQALRRQETAQRLAQKLQERWDRLMLQVERARAEGRALAERYPEYIAFTDQNEPQLPVIPEPEPEPQPMSLAQRMARAARAHSARKRWAA